MLTQIDVVCDNTFYIPVEGAKTRDSLQLQGITGLGPADKDLYIGEYSRDGGYYSGRRVGPRNPVLTIGINPNYGLGETMDGWRDFLYKAFNDPLPNSDGVQIILHDDTKEDRYFTGYCEKFTNEVFGDDTSCQISMVCPDPYIRDVTATSMTGSWTTVPFTYAGTAETGFQTTIEITTGTPTVTLSNNSEEMVLVYAPGFEIGDIITIDTVPGERSITLTRSGVTYDIYYTLYSESPWIFLHTTTNSLKVYGEDEADSIAAITSLTFIQTWWGL